MKGASTMIRESNMESSFYVNQYKNNEEDGLGYEFNQREIQPDEEYTSDPVQVRGKTPTK